jgi:Mg-chelatase subunit ChlD
MPTYVTPMELYHAARETCLRLYVANGGDAHAEWSITTHPQTAAIARERRYNGVVSRYVPYFRLAMPAFPLQSKLPRWRADLVAAYTVHELLHSLWTDFEVVEQSYACKLRNLTNAIEDCRIEARASNGALVQVSEARRLLGALNAHIVARAYKNPKFDIGDPNQFAFVLGVVIFVEKLGYDCAFPRNWRKHIPAERLPLFDLALSRFDALASTADSLTLAQDLKALVLTLGQPQPKQPPAPVPVNPKPDMSGDMSDDMSADDEGGEGGEGDKVGDEGDGGKGDEGDEGKGDEGDEGKGDEGDKAGDEDDDNLAGSLDDRAGDGDEAEGEPGGPATGGNNSQGGRREGDTPDTPDTDVSDDAQVYDDAHLNDLVQDALREANMPAHALHNEAQAANNLLNAPSLRDEDMATMRGADPKTAGAAIGAPAKLRRHLTLAVKSPERVAVERRQTSGRVDLRNHIGIAVGAPDIFRRRIEEEGREAAVTLLLDASSSMAGARIAAAKAMALHMGDALKAAGVKFEISAFDDRRLLTPKPFKSGWAKPTQRKVAGLQATGGTCMLPAMRTCVDRLARQGNVTRRILLVLTDGQDSYPETSNGALCRWARQRGVEVIGLALFMPGLERTFAGRIVHVWDIASLSTKGLGALVTVLGQA